MNYFIRSYHGGLGDELQFSTLPERLVKAGHPVYLYAGTDVLPFRNTGIRDLITMNPFVTIAPPDILQQWNLGDIPGVPYVPFTNKFIGNWEHAFGLAPGRGLPKIYYAPSGTRGIDGLIEISSKTLQYSFAEVAKTVLALMSSGHHYKLIISPSQDDRIILPDIPTLAVDNIFELCDAIASCRHLITVNSGTHSLAAAISRFHNFRHDSILPLHDSTWILRDKKFIFPCINYYVEGETEPIKV